MSDEPSTPSAVAVTGKKRGRKPKKDATEVAVPSSSAEENIQVVMEETAVGDVDDGVEVSQEGDNKPPTKKRGRKPKGGKIIQQSVPMVAEKEQKPNVILHLKCSLKDLHSNGYTFLGGQEIQGYNFSQGAGAPTGQPMSYESLAAAALTSASGEVEESRSVEDAEEGHTTSGYREAQDIREIWKKLKQLEHNLHINNICDKKSACFWCTYEFDNPPIYIPKHFIKESYHVYGCFCSPECAVAHLMEENIDSSAKFERYHLINHIYSKIFDYTKNIKPAPNPYYMLEKYYGNLSIQEYRALLRNERLFLIVDKPLTRVLPELHEDNDDFIINNKIIPSNTYQVKKKMQQRKQTKKTILSERFGLAAVPAAVGV